MKISIQCNQNEFLEDHFINRSSTEFANQSATVLFLKMSFHSLLITTTTSERWILYWLYMCTKCVPVFVVDSMKIVVKTKLKRTHILFPPPAHQPNTAKVCTLLMSKLHHFLLEAKHSFFFLYSQRGGGSLSYYFFSTSPLTHFLLSME